MLDMQPKADNRKKVREHILRRLRLEEWLRQHEHTHRRNDHYADVYRYRLADDLLAAFDEGKL
jgi:hypothetical protein